MMAQTPECHAAGVEVNEIMAEAREKIAAAELRKRQLVYLDALQYELRGVAARLEGAKERRKALDAEVKKTPAAYRADVETERDYAARQADYLAARVLSIQAEIDRIEL